MVLVHVERILVDREYRYINFVGQDYLFVRSDEFVQYVLQSRAPFAKTFTLPRFQQASETMFIYSYHHCRTRKEAATVQQYNRYGKEQASILNVVIVNSSASIERKYNNEAPVESSVTTL